MTWSQNACSSTALHALTIFTLFPQALPLRQVMSKKEGASDNYARRAAICGRALEFSQSCNCV
jgi:hypothetical protein